MKTAKNIVRRKIIIGVFSSLSAVLLFFLFIILFVCIVSAVLSSYEKEEVEDGLPRYVEAYRETVTEISAEYDMSSYVNVLLAIMAVETKGVGTDPMGASLFVYNADYSREEKGIQDAKYSIRCGIQQFRDLIDAATESAESPRALADMEDVKLAIQAYNFGNEYISWVKEREEGYTAANAREYSDLKAAEAGTAAFGDYYYVSQVLRYYHEASALPGESGDGVAGGIFVWPVPDHNPGNPFGDDHRGVDIPADKGTPILACDGGVVVTSEYHHHERSWGWYVLIDHGNGYTTRYAHMMEQGVPAGTPISAGQVVGYVGNTGYSFGEHLHLEITCNDVLIDPMSVLQGP